MPIQGRLQINYAASKILTAGEQLIMKELLQAHLLKLMIVK